MMQSPSFEASMEAMEAIKNNQIASSSSKMKKDHHTLLDGEHVKETTTKTSTTTTTTTAAAADGRTTTQGERTSEVASPPTTTTTADMISQQQQHQQQKQRRDWNDPFFREDGPLVGTPQILDSPNVTQPHYTHALTKPIPTPSVYADPRGEIHNVSVGGLRLNILYTKKGVMRSGDLHPITQCDFVYKGLVEVWTPQSDGTTLRCRYGPRDYVEVMAYTPHVFHFLEDTVMAEWWEERGIPKGGGDGDGGDSDGSGGGTATTATTTNGASSRFQQWFYGPYRSIVDTSFEWGSEGPRGTLKVYRQMEEKVVKEMEKKVEESMSFAERRFRGSLWKWTIGVGAFVLGVWVGRGKRASRVQ